MPLEITIDDKRLQAAIKKFPDRMAANLKRGMQKFGTDAVSGFTRTGLSAPDDRVAIPELGGLGIRPKGSRGLVRRSGSLARGFLTTTAGRLVSELTTRIGFLSPFAAKIAAVHEKGKRIVGRPFLAVPVRGLGAALGKAAGVVLLRAVTIPARLGFLPFMRRERPKLDANIREAIKRTIAGK